MPSPTVAPAGASPRSTSPSTTLGGGFPGPATAARSFATYDEGRTEDITLSQGRTEDVTMSQGATEDVTFSPGHTEDVTATSVIEHVLRADFSVGNSFGDDVDASDSARRSSAASVDVQDGRVGAVSPPAVSASPGHRSPPLSAALPPRAVSPMGTSQQPTPRSESATGRTPRVSRSPVEGVAAPVSTAAHTVPPTAVTLPPTAVTLPPTAVTLSPPASVAMAASTTGRAGAASGDPLASSGHVVLRSNQWMPDHETAFELLCSRESDRITACLAAVGRACDDHSNGPDSDVMVRQWYPQADACSVVVPQLLAMLDPSNIINIRYLYAAGPWS